MANPKGIVARAVLVMNTGDKFYIEIADDPDFYGFYSVARVKRGSRKKVVSPYGRNRGWAEDIEQAARKMIHQGRAKEVKVVSSKVLIYKKRRYLQLLKTAPNELNGGLSKIDSRNIPYHVGSIGPTQLPADYLSLQKRMDIVNPVER